MSSAEWKAANQEKMRAYRRKHYHSNKAPYLQRAKRQRSARREWLRGLKEGKSCMYCGESFWACLDFHHRDESRKLFNIGHPSAKFLAKKKIVEEIAKCDLICHNCHRKIHYGGLGLMETVRLQPGS